MIDNISHLHEFVPVAPRLSQIFAPLESTSTTSLAGFDHINRHSNQKSAPLYLGWLYQKLVLCQYSSFHKQLDCQCLIESNKPLVWV